jgi:hypothetical protein
MLYVLIFNRLFPTSPTYPCMAVLLFLLEFYNMLFKRSCNTVNALAHALSTFYTCCGFIPLNQKVWLHFIFCMFDRLIGHFQGQPILDAFHRGLGYAVQWYDNLQSCLECHVEMAVQSADRFVQGTLIILDP